MVFGIVTENETGKTEAYSFRDIISNSFEGESTNEG